jgi:EAL domain-containing protein (putative c-di-GMP-specific phosphodiesterase class I)
MTSGLVTGYEALMRWHHPERGMVPPSVFIPIAEEHGLIVAMGEWAIRQACKQAVALPENTRIAINLSPVQLSSSTIRQTIMEALESTGLPGSRLVFEITETTLLQQSEHTMDMLRYLRQIGISIAMDDFGTGYASLSYLLSFPFDLVKIDRSFVAKLGVDGQDADSTAVVRAMIEIANALGMKTIAEGVETEEQLARLQELGCVEAQGYLFSKPKPASEIAGMVMPLLKQRGEVKTTVEAQAVVVEAGAVESEALGTSAEATASDPAANAA